MTTNNRVLIVVDPTRTDDQVCVSRGAWLAESLGLGVDLLICCYEQFRTSDPFFDTPGLERVRKETLADNRSKLEKIAMPLQENGLDIVVTAIWDTPLDEGIVRHVLRTSPKIVVKEAHCHNKIDRALFSHTDWNLVRLCPEPLWLAKPHAWPVNATILASVDPTHEYDEYAELDHQILNPAALLAEKLNCGLHAFHSYIPISTNSAMHVKTPFVPGDDIGKEMENAHRDRLDALLDGYPVSAEYVHLMPGYPDRLLPELAKNIRAGLVVMGSIARNPLQQVYIGSTTEKTLDKLPCDLLVVKPLWFVCPVKTKPLKHFEGSPGNQVSQDNNESNSRGSTE